MACDFPRFEHQLVWVVRLRSAPFGVPEIRRLSVNRIFRRTVFAGAFFAVHIGNRPAVVTDGLAIRVEQIQFRHGGKRSAVVRVQRFEAEKSSTCRRGEFYFLRVRAWRKRTAVNRRGGIQIQFHRRAPRPGEIFVGTQLVENWFFEPLNYGAFRNKVIKNYKFIFSCVQPATRQISRL